MNQQPPTYRQLQLPIVNGVASKLEAILQRCGDRVKTGSVYFDEANEQRARAIAAADGPPDFPIPRLFGATAAESDATEVPSAV